MKAKAKAKTTSTLQMSFRWDDTQAVSNWEDVRMPNEYHAFYTKMGACLNCRMPLGHQLHAFNHFKKYHLKPVVVNPVKTGRKK